MRNGCNILRLKLCVSERALLCFASWRAVS